MPAFHSIDTDLLNALRSGGFAGELRFAVNPNTVVFQAAVNQTITNSDFVSFAWDGLLQGAYTDVVAGMTFMITATDDPLELRRPLLRGLVSQAPTSSVFYCGQADINLTDGMIVTVIANFEVVQMDRVLDLVHGYLPFQKQVPLVKNMQSFYYGEDDTEFEFSFAPIGQAMADGTTVVDYTYTIDGVTYNTQNLTVTVPYGHHWCYLDIEDSDGTPFRFIFEILVCLRDDDAFMFRAHNDVRIDGSIENGWNVTTTFFAGVETLLNRTRCAIVAFDVPKSGDGSLWPNVMFVGYIVSEETAVTGDEASAILSETRFELQSFADLAAQVPVPSLAIRDEDEPTAWEQMPKPTIQRAFGHMASRYSTLASLCAIDMLYTDSTWLADDLDFEAGTLLDTINTLGERIQAKLVFFPAGDACFEINANILSDSERDALPTLLVSGSLETQDLFSYSMPIPYYRTVGQLIVGCATFYTDGSDALTLKAIAPKTGRQEGPETPVIPNQLLPSDLSEAEAIAASGQRVGDLFEYVNPATMLPNTMKDGWRLLTPSTRVWLTYDLPGTDSTRGLAIPSTERWLLLSVSLNWSVQNGTWSVQATPRLETQGGLAQRGATISPNVIETDRPVLPSLSDYDAYTPDGSLNYLTTDPDAVDRQPFDPFDMEQYTPMTTETAAAAADNTPTGDCGIVTPAVVFSDSTSQLTPRATVLGQKYTATIKGSARIFEPNPFALFVGGVNLISHVGDVWRVEMTGGSLGWGSPLDDTNCYVMQFNVISGFISTGSCLDCAGNSISFGALPQNVRYFDMGGTPGTIIDFTFTGGPPARDGDAFYEETSDGEWELYTGGRGLLINGLPVGSPPEFDENHEYSVDYIGDGNRTPFTYYDTNYDDNANRPLPIKVCGPNMGS